MHVCVCVCVCVHVFVCVYICMYKLKMSWSIKRNNLFLKILSKTPSMSVLDMTRNNLMVRLQ